MFQFQTGSIKSQSNIVCWPNIDKFQFQTGSIKSQGITWDDTSVLVRFNSKLVRLKGVPFHDTR